MAKQQRQIIELPAAIFAGYKSTKNWAERAKLHDAVFDWLMAYFAQHTPEEKFSVRGPMELNDVHRLDLTRTVFDSKSGQYVREAVHPSILGKHNYSRYSWRRAVRDIDGVKCLELQYWVPGSVSNPHSTATLIDLRVNQITILKGKVEVQATNGKSVQDPNAKVRLRLRCKVALIENGILTKRNRVFLLDPDDHTITDLKKNPVEISNSDMVFEAIQGA